MKLHHKMDSKGKRKNQPGFILDNHYFVTAYFETYMFLHINRRDKTFIHLLQFLLSTNFFIADILAEIETKGFLRYDDVCHKHWFKYYCAMDHQSFEYYFKLGKRKPDNWYLRYKINYEVVYTEPLVVYRELLAISIKPAVVSTEPSVVSTEPSMVSTEPSVVSTEPSVVSTEQSVVSTEPSVVSTEPSVVSTEPSVVSTEPSVVSTEPSVVSTEPSR